MASDPVEAQMSPSYGSQEHVLQQSQGLCSSGERARIDRQEEYGNHDSAATAGSSSQGTADTLQLSGQGWAMGIKLQAECHRCLL